MEKLLKFYLLCILLTGLIQCSESSNPQDNTGTRELTVAEQEIVSSDNNFGLKLFREVIEDEDDRNVFISPLSVAMALGMTYNGAGGDTREDMKMTLELSGLSGNDINESYESLIKLLRGLDDKVIFQIANSIWYRMGWNFEEDFLNINKTYFDAFVSGIDFNDPKAHEIINKWVEYNTNGH